MLVNGCLGLSREIWHDYLKLSPDGDLSGALSVSIAQLVIAWTAFESRASHVLCGTSHNDSVAEISRVCIVFMMPMPLGLRLTLTSSSAELMTGALLNRRRKLSVRTKSGSNKAARGQGYCGGIATVLFYNQLLGVSPALVGTAFLIASAFDALSDPLIGAITDRFRSKWGRRHPFMFASALPIELLFSFINPANDLPEIGYFVWLCFFDLCCDCHDLISSHTMHWELNSPTTMKSEPRYLATIVHVV